MKNDNPVFSPDEDLDSLYHNGKAAFGPIGNILTLAILTVSPVSKDHHTYLRLNFHRRIYAAKFINDLTKVFGNRVFALNPKSDDCKKLKKSGVRFVIREAGDNDPNAYGLDHIWENFSIIYTTSSDHVQPFSESLIDIDFDYTDTKQIFFSADEESKIYSNNAFEHLMNRVNYILQIAHCQFDDDELSPELRFEVPIPYFAEPPVGLPYAIRNVSLLTRKALRYTKHTTSITPYYAMEFVLKLLLETNVTDRRPNISDRALKLFQWLKLINLGSPNRTLNEILSLLRSKNFKVLAKREAESNDPNFPIIKSHEYPYPMKLRRDLEELLNAGIVTLESDNQPHQWGLSSHFLSYKPGNIYRMILTLVQQKINELSQEIKTAQVEDRK